MRCAIANRFTDSRKWDDPWFRKLPCKYKAFFLFLIDKCDHAGIWKVDFESAEFHIGETLIKKEVLGMMNGRIIELKEKWFIPKFINFQYQVASIKDLNPENRVHKSVIDILKKEGAYKGLKMPSEGCKDKDYDKDKDNKGIVKGSDFISSLKTNPAYKGIDLETEFGKMDAWLLAHPGRQKTKRFIVNWLNKIDKPIIMKKPDIKPDRPPPINEEERKKVSVLIHETTEKMKGKK